MKVLFLDRSRLKEMEERLAQLQNGNENKENNPVNHTCSGCGQLRQDLDITLRVLNDQSCAKYGDLLRNNFTLTHKVKYSSSWVLVSSPGPAQLFNVKRRKRRAWYTSACEVERYHNFCL